MDAQSDASKHSDASKLPDATSLHDAIADVGTVLDQHVVDAPADVLSDSHALSDAAPGTDAATNVIDLAVGDDPNTTMPVVTVQISIGGSPPFTALVDTGSVGLHVVTGTIPDADWTLTTTATSTTYGTGVITSGVIATGVVTIGGMATTEPISIVDITSVSCVASKPSCAAAGEQGSAYRYRGDYPANIGIGMRANAGVNLASPFAFLGHDQRYLLELPAFGGTVGQAIIDPTAAQVSRFTTLVQLVSSGSATASGVNAWNDTQVPYCMNSFCSVGLMDTGASAATVSPGTAAAFMKLGIADNATSVPAGTLVNEAIDTTATWSYTVESPPVEGKDSINIGTTTSGSDNLSIAPFYVFDMLYDYSAGQIGLAPKL